jgi:hypothetical protein
MSNRFATAAVNATRNEVQTASAGVQNGPETGAFKRRVDMFVRYPITPRRATDTARGS